MLGLLVLFLFKKKVHYVNIISGLLSCMLYFDQIAHILYLVSFRISLSPTDYMIGKVTASAASEQLR